MGRTLDKELVAIRRISSLLSDLEPAELQRVLQFVEQKFKSAAFGYTTAHNITGGHVHSEPNGFHKGE